MQGSYTQEELQLAVDRRSTRLAMDAVEIDKAIIERYYQERAVRNVTAPLERKRRKALLVMATCAARRVR